MLEGLEFAQAFGIVTRVPMFGVKDIVWHRLGFKQGSCLGFHFNSHTLMFRLPIRKSRYHHVSSFLQFRDTYRYKHL